MPSLTERLVVFTGQRAPSPAYQSFVVDKVKLDIRQLSAQRVLGIALPAERQDQQNVTKLKSLGTERWTRLVDLIAAHRYDVDPAEIRRICGIKPANEEQQTNAIIGNMVRVVDALHDPSSQMLRALKTALSDGKLCVVDISQLRGQRGLQLASIILAEIFSHNQREFTKAKPEIVPCIAVVEEAQTVLAPSATSAEDSPFVSWVKEGRKYGLGAVLVTQQPGSIPPELLSQGDNFFVFHLLSAGDLAALKRANAHFSDDLLATLLNEPLVGHGVFWSSAPGTDRSARPYPLPVRVLSFEAEHRELRDPSYSLGPVDCYAARLRGRFRGALAAAAPAAAAPAASVDAEAAYRKAAISALRNRPEFGQRLASGHGVAWGKVQAWLTQAAPPEEVVGDRFEWAYQVVRPALLEILGPEGSGWRTETRARPDRPGSSQTWIFLTDTVEAIEHAPPPEDQNLLSRTNAADSAESNDLSRRWRGLPRRAARSACACSHSAEPSDAGDDAGRWQTCGMPYERDVRAFDQRAVTYDSGWLGRMHHEISDRVADLALRQAAGAAPGARCRLRHRLPAESARQQAAGCR